MKLIRNATIVLLLFCSPAAVLSKDEEPKDFDIVSQLEAIRNSAANVDSTKTALDGVILRIKDDRTIENSITKAKVGYLSFAPYVIREVEDAPESYVLEKGGPSGSAFVEIAFADRNVWRVEENLGRRLIDWEAKLGFVLKKDSGGEDISGSALAAAGDIYAELSIGFPLFYSGPQRGVHFSIGLEGVGTLVTDKASLDIHDSEKLVIAFVAREKVPNKRSWQLLTRLGWGWTEVPDIDGQLNLYLENTLPKFKEEDGVFTQVLFELPILEYSTISVSGEFWGGLEINPWSTYISYSTSFSGLRSILP